MWLLNWKRMSASKWTAILSSDLINTYWWINSRIIMIFSWWHPSKVFEYDINTPKEIENILKKFSNYISYLNLCIKNDINSFKENDELLKIENKIIKDMDNWYFKQALIELLIIIPKKYSLPNKKSASDILKLYKKYLDILTPGLINNFNYE
jgi:hypothetical protein